MSEELTFQARTKHSGTYSSDGWQESSAMQTINFARPVNSITFACRLEADEFNVRINGETVNHLVTFDGGLIIEDIEIDSITIVEADKTYMYDALHI